MHMITIRTNKRKFTPNRNKNTQTQNVKGERTYAKYAKLRAKIQPSMQDNKNL